MRESAPEQFRSWTRAGLVAALGGFGAATAQLLVSGGLASTLIHVDPWVTLSCGVALLVERPERTVSVARAMLLVVWGALLLDIGLSDSGLSSPAAIMAPLTIAAAAVALGRRAMFAMASATAVLGPLAVVIGGAFDLGPGLSSGDANATLVFAAANLGIALITSQFLGSYEAALVRAQAHAEQAASLVEEAPDAIVGLDDRGRIAAFNRRAEKLMKIPREEVLGQKLSVLPLEAVGTMGSSEATGRPIELQLGERTLELVARRGRRETGLVTTLIMRDVSERKQAEERAASFQSQLQHAQKIEAIGLLAGGIAHDFNNLLTAVGGYATMIAKLSQGEIREMAEGLVSAQQRGVSLTRQLLAFSRQDVTQPEPIMLGQVIDDMETLLQRLAGEQVTVDLDTQPGVCVFADPGQLEQVLINLTANARDAMDGTGTVHVACRVDGDEVELVVRDSGHGMPEGLEERIFEPFFTTKPRGKGTGLGLSTVLGIVTESKGTIRVESEEGVGTEFRLRWPLCRIGLNRHQPQSPALDISQNTARILVAEDDEHTRSFVQHVLERAGFDVHVARNGPDAIAVAHAMPDPPELLLTDVIMPSMNGVELADALKKSLPELRVLFMSGYVDDVIGIDAINLVDDLLMKPFSAHDLLSRLAQKVSRDESNNDVAA